MLNIRVENFIANLADLLGSNTGGLDAIRSNDSWTGGDVESLPGERGVVDVGDVVPRKLDSLPLGLHGSLSELKCSVKSAHGFRPDR